MLSKFWDTNQWKVSPLKFIWATWCRIIKMEWKHVTIVYTMQYIGNWSSHFYRNSFYLMLSTTKNAAKKKKVVHACIRRANVFTNAVLHLGHLWTVISCEVLYVCRFYKFRCLVTFQDYALALQIAWKLRIQVLHAYNLFICTEVIIKTHEPCYLPCFLHQIHRLFLSLHLSLLESLRYCQHARDL